MEKKKTGFDGRTNASDEWYTPKYILENLGTFDLDPCTGSARPFDIAKISFTKTENGLAQNWIGRVWCNPPYGINTKIWLARMSEHQNGIALIFARTETKMFFDYIWNHASGILFLRGRISFLNADGSRGKYSGGAPSCLVAWGSDNAKALENCGLIGKYISLAGASKC